ncbi:hypothetical protein [Streptomyces sp. NPDC017095]|uniref:hypothetical protein n=1 Tax=Streptomyces sp. NPDC017095 TaxID=3364977 RepID=UPI0037B1ACCF
MMTIPARRSSATGTRLSRALAWTLGLLLAFAVVPAAVGPTPARADNPIVQHVYTADPAPLVHDGRVYLYTGHDEDGSTYYTMKDWRVWSARRNWSEGFRLDLLTTCADSIGSGPVLSLRRTSASRSVIIRLW